MEVAGILIRIKRNRTAFFFFREKNELPGIEFQAMKKKEFQTDFGDVAMTG